MGRLVSTPHSFRAAWRAGSENQTKGCCGKPGFRGLRSWAGMTQGVAGLSPVGPKATSPGDPVPTPGLRASAPCAPATRTRPPARSEAPHQTIVLSNTILPPSLCGPAPGLANNSASDWPGAPRQSQNSTSSPPRLRAPRCVLGLVGPADVEGPVIRWCQLPYRQN